MPYLKSFLAAFFLFSFSGFASAESIAPGTYEGAGDGDTVTLKIDGNDAHVSTILVGKCTGAAEGRLVQTDPGTYLLSDTQYRDISVCTIEIKDLGKGKLSVRDIGGCMPHHGMQCGFNADVSLK